jgi:hypothetical protein
MSSKQSTQARPAGMVPVALAALALLAFAVALVAPAQAAPGKGTAAIILAEHSKGRTLSGQGVKVLANAPATQTGRTVELPISAVDPGTSASASSEASLRFKRGDRSVVLSGIKLNLSAGTLSGKLGGEEIEVLKLGAAASANATTGAVGLQGGKLRLSADAATALKQKLGLRRALRRDGVGMAWLAAQASPTYGAAKAVTAGSANWGVLASWRAYVLGQQGPPMSKGTITVEGGATANGTLSDAGAFFGFPASSGSYEKGLYGAADKLALKTQGSVVFAKPFHCIITIDLASFEVVIDGASSALVVGDYGYDIDEFNGMACVDKPAVLAPGTKFAILDPSMVTPSYSAGGKTVTWSGIPATLTAAGAVPFSPTYKAGQVLDPITVAVTTG